MDKEAMIALMAAQLIAPWRGEVTDSVIDSKIAQAERIWRRVIKYEE